MVEGKYDTILGMNSVKLIIEKKREGHALGTAEIRDFIDGYTKGEIPDYQMSAMAMAICCRGMNERETNDLTEAMMKSGRVLSWEGVTADKHSSGGVGDKLSLIIQPLAAACGVWVPSLIGRSLGITGGTADKLETIPGFSCSQSLERFQEIVRSVGVSMAVQTDEITPADKKLYALRDVTGTVASIPLITGSVLSKKLAEGAGTLIFDVKCGKGAFMKTREEAKALADSLVSGAKAAGRKSAALVTDMDAPLGKAVGNAIEVGEALKWLKSDIDEVSAASASDSPLGLALELAAMMVALAKDMPLNAARTLCAEKLVDGSALESFKAMVEAQGGDLSRFETTTLTAPTVKFRIQAMKSGYVEAIDAEKVGRASMMLGAGREKAGDKIDPLAGVELAVKRGDKVAIGAPLATLMKSGDPDGLEKAAAELYKAFTIVPTPVAIKALILERIS